MNTKTKEIFKGIITGGLIGFFGTYIILIISFLLIQFILWERFDLYLIIIDIMFFRMAIALSIILAILGGWIYSW